MPRSDVADHVRATRLLFAMALGWCIVLGVLNAAAPVVGFLLLLFSLIGMPALLIGAGLVQGWQGVRLAAAYCGRERLVAALVVPVALVVTVPLLMPGLRIGNAAGWYGRLIVRHAAYQRIIADTRDCIARGASACGGTTPGSPYVDAGPPLRMAFDLSGFLDNWTGIVFDPTGQVMLAKGFDRATGRFIAPDRMTKLFGGDLIGCRRMGDSYYLCSFT